MDTRTDPGQYYPGGRIMVRPDVAPDQGRVIRWGDIQDKPDFSDIPELEAADSDDNVKTAVNKIVDKMKTAVIVLLCGLCAALSAPAATMLNYMPGTNELYTAAETDAAIVRLAPAPGNYAAVSNAAMNALSRAEAKAGFTRWIILRDGVDVTAQVEQPLWDDEIDGGKWDCAPSTLPAERDGVAVPWHGSSMYDIALSWEAGEFDDIEYTATRTRLPTMADIAAATNGIPRITESESIPGGAARAERAIYANEAIRANNASEADNAGNAYSLGHRAAPAIIEQLDAATVTNAAQQAALSTHASQLSQQSQSISTLGSQVSAIGAHLNAEDARFVSTNYNSATHMPEAYVEVKITENGVSSWLTVWREMTRWDWFLGVYTNQYAAQTAALATKGEKEYAFYDGVTGEPAPDGFFWIAQPRVAVAAGMSYQRYVDTGGAVWVLESNGMVADVNGTTNGFFRISDDEGNTQFEIVKGSSRTVTAVPGVMSRESVMGVTHWFTTYAVTNAASAPVAMFCRDIGSQEWHSETDGDCPCNVSWTNPESGVYVCEWWAKGTEPQMFMKAKYGQGTESRIVQTAPVEMQYIVIKGVKYTLGTATISGSTVLTLTPVSP